MLFKGQQLADLIQSGAKAEETGVSVTPCPSIEEIERSGSASIDLRLGRWFVTVRQSKQEVIKIARHGDEAREEIKLTKKYFVPFNKQYILHPGRFVLGSTLEWIRLPSNIAGYVTGKSSWGRRGLIIETAAGVHPGFTGCLTLELANIGEIPIAIEPGVRICQVFFHQTSNGSSGELGSFSCRRRPNLGQIKPDRYLENLRTL